MLIRLDDFPTGVRPIADLTNHWRIMDAFDRRDIPFYVGIVPDLLTDDHARLRDYRCLTPAQHGFDHKYHKYAPLLKDDPKNSKTVGVFDEFENVPYNKIQERLYRGRKALERFMGQKIETFIPVCNIINKYTAKALKILGYRRILTENPINTLPCIKSDFYGRLYELDGDPQVVTLHLTWEGDWIEENGWPAWEALLDRWSTRISDRLPKEPKILFKIASRGRPKKLIEVLDQYYKMIHGTNFMFVVTLDRDDSTVNKSLLNKLAMYDRLTVKIGDSKTKIEAMNADIPDKGWDIIVLLSDDMIPKVDGFDKIIRQKMKRLYPDLDGVLWFNDGYQKKQVNTLSIMGKTYYDRFGYLYYPEYRSQRCDVEFQTVAESLGKQTYIDQTIIRHEHPAWGHGKGDAILANNMKNLRHDADLFARRKKLKFPRGIPHVANFYHNAETPLSYLRYLSMMTFRHFHPDWAIRLYTGKSNTVVQWGGTERQDFSSYTGDDWLPRLSSLRVDMREFDRPELNPNYVSDVFRWWALADGGWYFDTDQIFTANFDKISYEYDVVYGGRTHKYCGVVGACRGSELVRKMTDLQAERLGSIKHYCDIGNWLWTEVLNGYRGQDKVFQTPDKYFYPVTDSHMVKDRLFSGATDIGKIGGMAVHLFGGHPDTQVFNATFDGTGQDSISKYLRSLA